MHCDTLDQPDMKNSSSRQVLMRCRLYKAVQSAEAGSLSEQMELQLHSR